MRDNVIETTKGIMTKTVPAKSIPTNPNEKKVICKMKNFYITLAFLLVTMTLLIVVSIYCFIKYRAKQKNLLPIYHFTTPVISILNVYYENGKY